MNRVKVTVLSHLLCEASHKILTTNASWKHYCGKIEYKGIVIKDRGMSDKDSTTLMFTPSKEQKRLLELDIASIPSPTIKVNVDTSMISTMVNNAIEEMEELIEDELYDIPDETLIDILRDRGYKVIDKRVAME